MITTSVRKLLLLFIVATLLSGCGTTDKMEYYEDTDSTSLSENVNNITLNTPEEQVTEILGTPDNTQQTEKPKSTYFIYGKSKSNSDIELQITDGKVKSYFFSSDKYKTQKGITINEQKENVIQKYGKSYYERGDSGSEIIGYFDKTNKTNIEFSFVDNVLKGIMVSTIQ